MMPPRIAAVLFSAALACAPRLSAGLLEEQITALRDGDFEARNAAENALGAAAMVNADALLPLLLAADLQKDPEARLRTNRIFRKVFEKQVLRVGATTINAEFGRFLWVYNDSRPSIGPIVEKIPDGSKAAKGGLKPGDNIRAVDGKDLGYSDGLEDLRMVIAAREPGEIVHLKIWRVGLGEGNREVAGKGSWFECEVELEKGPDEPYRAERTGEFGAWKNALAARLQPR